MSQTPADVSFSKIAVEQKFVTPAQVEEAVEVQRKMEVLGVYPKSLAEILVEKGALSQYLVRTIYRIQGQREGFPEIPGYEFEAKIGHGGMGTVYRARQVNLDRPVAVKILAPDLARDENFVKRFRSEARAAAALNHENVIVAIQVGCTAGGDYFFVMEYVEGETVYEILGRDHHLDEKKALNIALQIARALKHAADHNLVHRDVKPDNIMITREGVAKLCDLGLAKSTRARLRLTHAGSTHGTPHYMSPEQARGREDLDIRSDVYSLGATLYHMLVGEVPFDGESAAVILLKHISEDLPSPRVRRPEVSENACHVLERMMAKRAEDRYQAPQDLIDDLERVLAGESPRSARPSPGQSNILRIPTEPGALPAVPDGFREEATEPMARSDLTGAGFLVPLVAVSAGMFCILLAAGAASGFWKSPRPADLPVSPRPDSPKPPRPLVNNPTVEEEKYAWDHWQDAVRRAAARPGDRKGHLEHLLAILQRFPGSRGAFLAEEEILKVLAAEDREVERAQEKLQPEIRACLESGRFDEARKRSQEALARFAYLEKVADRLHSFGDLRALAEQVEARASARGRELVSEADRLEKADDLAGACKALEEAAGLGIPAVEAAARPRITGLRDRIAEEEKKERRREETAARLRYFDALSAVAEDLGARRYDKAAAFLRDAAASRDLEGHRESVSRFEGVAAEARAVWARAVERLRALSGLNAETVFKLRAGGEEVGGFPGAPDAEGAFQVFFDPERRNAKRSLRVSDLAGSEILELAGLYEGMALGPADLVRRATFLLAEGDLQEARNDLDRADKKGAAVKGLLDAVADLGGASTEVLAGRGLVEGETLMRAGEWKKARSILQRFASDWKATILRESQGARIQDDLAKCEEILIRGTNLEALFSGKAEKTPGGRHCVSYDFATLSQAQDWRFVRGGGAGDWVQAAGPGWRGAAGAGLRWIARFGGPIEIEAVLRVEEAGRYAEFLRLEYPEAAFAIRLGLGEGPHQVFRVTKPPGGQETWDSVGQRAASPLKPGDEVRVLVQAGPERILLRIGTEILEVDQGPAGTGKLSIWASPGPLTFRGLRIECLLDPGWVLGE